MGGISLPFYHLQKEGPTNTGPVAEAVSDTLVPLHLTLFFVNTQIFISHHLEGTCGLGLLAKQLEDQNNSCLYYI